jgi:hypothetical protein
LHSQFRRTRDPAAAVPRQRAAPAVAAQARRDGDVLLKVSTSDHGTLAACAAAM